MKKAFTIIELIFVIIILGILAAIAIPKLNASRADAQITKTLSNLKIVISDITSYMLKNGELAQTSLMSNVGELEDTNLANFGKKIEIPFAVGKDKTCVNLSFVQEDEVLLFGIGFDGSKTLTDLGAIAKAQADLNAKPDDKALQTALADANKKLYDENIKPSKSASRTCKSLLANESFKSMARRVYVLSAG